jgi:hypothetical protein
LYVTAFTFSFSTTTTTTPTTTYLDKAGWLALYFLAAEKGTVSELAFCTFRMTWPLDEYLPLSVKYTRIMCKMNAHLAF